MEKNRIQNIAGMSAVIFMIAAGSASGADKVMAMEAGAAKADLTVQSVLR